LAAAATQGSFFTVPYGGAIGAGTKNWSHTNMVLAGQLQRGNSLEVYGFSFNFVQDASAGAVPTWADMQAINAGNIRFVVGGNAEVCKLTVGAIPSAGNDWVFFSNITPAATEFYLAKGVQAHRNMYTLNDWGLGPYPIEANESFEVIIENMGTIAAATRIQFWLWGVYTRPTR
jgi:hypothetical protein